MPLVSVVIPAYNAADCLEAAVRSALSQSLSDIEVIIVDDGSQDGTFALCDALSAADGRVRVLHKENGGVSEARNDGIAAAQGKYIAFLDADDSFEPDMLKKLTDAADAAGTDAAICGFYRLYPDGGREVSLSPLSEGAHSPEETMRGLVLPLLQERLCAGAVEGFIWRCIFSRERILSAGLRFSGAYLEDELFIIEYFAPGVGVASVPEPLYNYVQNPASVTRRYLKDYEKTFFASYAVKKALVERYSIPVRDGWENNTLWAGLLISVANVFAPGSGMSFGEKYAALRSLRSDGRYLEAIRALRPVGLSRNKAVVAALLRWGLCLPLALLYTYKNRNRGQ